MSLRDCTLRPPKIVPFKKTLDPSSITSPKEKTGLSLGSTTLERGKNTHLPASPTHTLAVTSTPNPEFRGGSQRSWAVKEATPSKLGRRVFSPTSSRGGARGDFKQELGRFSALLHSSPRQ